MISASSRTRNCVVMKYNVFLMANAQTMCLHSFYCVDMSA